MKTKTTVSLSDVKRLEKRVVELSLEIVQLKRIQQTDADLLTSRTANYQNQIASQARLIDEEREVLAKLRRKGVCAIETLRAGRTKIHDMNRVNFSRADLILQGLFTIEDSLKALAD